MSLTINAGPGAGTRRSLIRTAAWAVFGALVPAFARRPIALGVGAFDGSPGLCPSVAVEKALRRMRAGIVGRRREDRSKLAFHPRGPVVSPHANGRSLRKWVGDVMGEISDAIMQTTMTSAGDPACHPTFAMLRIATPFS